MQVIHFLDWLFCAINLVLLVFFLIVGFIYWSRHRFLWCRCGSPHLWESDPFGPCTSQHLLDPYSVAHLGHGVLFGGVLGLMIESHYWVVSLAIILELTWELIENSTFVINQYRSSPISADYQGDSLLNSFGDVLSCAVGAVVTVNVPYDLAFIPMFFSLELLNTFWIRSCNTIDLISLLFHPRWLAEWQSKARQGGP